MTSPPAGGDDRRSVYPVTIDGPRVQLRDFQDGDLDASLSIVGDPQVTWYLSFETRTREQQATLLAADLARARSDPRPDYYLAAIEKTTDTMIGVVRLAFDRPRTAELGYAIRHDGVTPLRSRRSCSSTASPPSACTASRPRAAPTTPPPSGSWPSSASGTRAGCATTSSPTAPGVASDRRYEADHHVYPVANTKAPVLPRVMC